MEMIILILIITCLLWFLASFVIPAVLVLWPVWLIAAVFLAVFRAFRKHPEDEGDDGYTTQSQNPDVIDADYTIKDEEDDD